MRVAFFVDDSTTIHFFNAQAMHDEKPEPLVGVWEAGDVNWSTASLDQWQCRLMRFVGAVDKEHGGTPLKLCRALLGLGGKQVVWDGKAERYRNISTAQDALKVFQLTGTKITVEAEDEAEAKKRARARLMAAMEADPESAPRLAEWFARGTVKLVDSGEVPKAVALKELAQGGAEVKLAEAPIVKLSMRDEKEESAE